MEFSTGIRSRILHIKLKITDLEWAGSVLTIKSLILHLASARVSPIEK